MSAAVTKEGPGCWRVMHHAADKGIDVIDVVINSLSCKECRHHSRREVHRLRQIYGDDIFTITVELHNMVNIKKNKPTWTVEQARNHIRGTCTNCNVTERTKRSMLVPKHKARMW